MSRCALGLVMVWALASAAQTFPKSSGSPSNPADRNCWSGLRPGRPAGTLTIDPLVDAVLDLDQVNGRLRGQQSNVARCYQKFAASRTVDTKVTARFTTAGRIEVLSVSDAAPELEACVKTVLRGWAMPKLTTPVDTTLVFHFVAAEAPPKP